MKDASLKQQLFHPEWGLMGSSHREAGHSTLKKVLPDEQERKPVALDASEQHQT